ncbi:hypothetical protein SAMN04487968_11248 [Nocardioides terrae]|uniref:Uncharacterized protein n=1 Tax=Nocardioides terrae TaxID=574651 RepID=A0A1I1MEA3_9ACTN|nr:hypothetical protein [Nocardioides terrae]SFC83476.1 hypothetical protein SAMN04487968_11248 [Nocardioides terrae]
MPSPSRAVLALVAALVATGGAVTAGVALRSPEPAPTSHPLATRLASIDTTTAVVRREAWCDDLAAADVHAAVDDSSPKASSWANGDPLGASRDVAHEFGCSWVGASGVTAAGWVFAPPVTVARADELVASAQAQPGCSPLAGAAAFGSPAVALTCTADGATTLSYRGLFGDAWLVCTLGGATASEPDLADRWCASVLRAAG